MISYYFTGNSAIDQGYLRQNHIQDEVIAYAATNHFNGNTTANFMSDRKVVTIDGAVQVTTLLDIPRSNALKHWNTLASGCNKTFKATLITGTLLTAAGVIGGLTTLTFPPLIIIAIPTLAIGITVLCGAKIASNRQKNAQVELDSWADPTSRAAELRKSANFESISKNPRLIGTIFHDDEVLPLWAISLESFIYKHESGINYGNIEAFKSFFANCPFSEEALQLAFKEKACSFQGVFTRFGALKNTFDQVLQKYELERNKVRTGLNSQISQLEGNRLRELTAANNNPRSRGAINSRYDSNIRRLRQEAAERIQALNNQENIDILTLKDNVLNFLKEFKNHTRPNSGNDHREASAPPLYSE